MSSPAGGDGIPLAFWKMLNALWLKGPYTKGIPSSGFDKRNSFQG